MPPDEEDEEELTLQNAGQGPVMLELVEGFLQHVLRVDLLHSQQVQHHVVGQVEGTVQGVRRALYHRGKQRTMSHDNELIL